MKSNANQASELRSSLAPCSLLGFKDPTFFLVGAASRFLGLAAFSPETSQIHEIHEIQWKSMNFDGIHENQPRELRSSLAPCSLLRFRNPTFFLVGAPLPGHRLKPRTLEIQARQLRSSLAPCSLLGFRDPTFFLVGTQFAATGCQHSLQKPYKSTNFIKFHENR